MPKILVVEDEPIEREALKQQLAGDFGSENILTAETVNEALNAVKETRPDLVLLDIMLKNSSGFEVAGFIKKEFPNIRIIILTAYNEFDFAYNALNLHIDDYLLKPVRPSLLIERVKKVLDRKTLKAWNMPIWPYLERNITEPLKNILPLYPNIILICGFKTDLNLSLIYKAVSILQILLQDIGWVETRESLIIIYIKMTDKENIKKMIAEFNQKFNQEIFQSATFGVGGFFSEINEMANGYREAKLAYYNTLFFPEKDILFYEHNNQSKNTSPQVYPYTLEMDIMNSLMCYNFDNAKKNLYIFAEYLLKHCENNYLILKEWYENFYFSLNRFCEQRGIKIRLDVFNKYWNTKSDFYKELENNINLVINSLCNLPGVNDPVIRKVLSILNFDYNKDITLYDVSKQIGINPVYLSHLFKRLTGHSFKSFLTTLRMERAKALLSDTQIPISDIARSVGYQDPNYFSIAFKKYQGISPSEYRGNINTPD